MPGCAKFATKPSSTSSNTMTLPRIAITAGEPAGIGPDVLLAIAQQAWPADLVAVADPGLLARRAKLLGLSIQLDEFQPDQEPRRHQAGRLAVSAVTLAEPEIPGTLNPANAGYVVNTLQQAAQGCLNGRFDAMVTAPVQKSVINDAGTPFSGHTEFLAAETGTDRVVMLLASGELRVALATTHLPLAEVPAAITPELLEQTLTILHADLMARFGLANPRISVLGLNPHAGEGGHLGREEIEVIMPTLDKLRGQGLQLTGPLPADTAFNADTREQTDAYLAMYHDQGLPVLKFAGFGEAVNVTLGLPIVRTSVDHGTALGIAGSGQASAGSLKAALALAIQLADHR